MIQPVKTHFGERSRQRMQRVWEELHGLPAMVAGEARRSARGGAHAAAVHAPGADGAAINAEAHEPAGDAFEVPSAACEAPDAPVAAGAASRAQGAPVGALPAREKAAGARWRDATPAQAAALDSTQRHTAPAQGELGDAAPEASADIDWGNTTTQARLLQVTPSVLVLDGELPEGPPPPPGSPVNVHLPGTPRAVPARVAAYGQGRRYLLSLGTRAVRGAVRVAVDVPAVLRSPALPRPANVRIVDLSSSGARLRGVQLAVGCDMELSFIPPGRLDSVTMRNVVVRAMHEADAPEIGVAFCGATLSFSVELTHGSHRAPRHRAQLEEPGRGEPRLLARG